MARDGDNIYRAIYQQQYPQAITSSMDFLSNLIDLISKNKATGTKIIADLNTVMTAGGHTISASSLDKISRGDWKVIQEKANSARLSNGDAAILQSALQYKQFIGLSELMTRLTSYGMFIANLVNAQTADDVENVVENAALPVGSSSVKKNSLFTIQVQSYLGASFRIDNPRVTYNSPWTDRLGVAAPIGVGFNFGLKKGGSVGLFVNLLDIGAIVDYQLKVDTTTVNSSGTPSTTIDKNYQVKLGQIFSPGFYAVYGFLHNLPIAVGIGAQYGPGLGKINSDGSEVVSNPSWRCNVFLAVDIPFFNILNVKFAHPKP